MPDDDDDDATSDVTTPARLNRATARASPIASAPRRGAGSPFDPPGARFVAGDELGRGGMGRVIAATDVALERSVAIKQALTTSAADQVRFEREVRITARLQHPGIVPVLDAGRDADGRPYYVMRRIEGDPLGARVAAGRALDDRLALIPNLLAVADAIAYAHAQGIIHRDLKPSNVLLGPFGETLVIDWGLARELAGGADAPSVPGTGDDLTRAGRAFGTPGFMAPEQARGERADRRSDVYALGATLYYVLAGAPPHHDAGPSEAIERTAAERGPDLARIPDTAPRDLIAIARKALAGRPEQRYADAGELAADLRRFLTGQLVLAHRYTLAQRAVRLVRRHRLAVAVGALAAVAIAAIAVVAARRVIDERDEAARARDLAEDRGDAELVGRAEAFAAIDPTSAIAVLKQLRPGSRHTARAAAVATAAVAAGVAQGDRLHTGGVAVLAISPDGRALLSAGVDGKLVVRDLASRHALLAVQLDGSIEDALWTSATTIACVTRSPGVVAIALDGTRRAVAPGERIAALGRWHGTTIARTADRVIELDTGRTIAGDVSSWYVAADALVVSNGRELRWVDAAATLAGAPFGRLTGASTRAGDRFAADLPDGVVEWRLEGGHPVEVGRWRLALAGRRSHAERLIYFEDALYALDWSRTWWRLQPAGEHTYAGWPAASLVAAIPGGLAFADESGSLAILDTTGVTPLVHRPIEVAALTGADRGQWLAAATRFGEVIAWDLSTSRPKTYAATGGPLLGLDDTAIWFADGESVARLDRRDGTRSTFPVAPLTDIYLAGSGELIAHSKLLRTIAVWSRDARLVAKLDRAVAVTHADRADGGLLYVLDDAGAITERPVRRPHDARAIAAVVGAHGLTIGGAGAPAWLAVRARDRVERIDLRDGTRAVARTAELDALAFDPAGTLWGTTPAGLWRWDGHGAPTTVIPVARGAWLYTTAPGGVITWSSDGVLYNVDAAGRVTRRIQTEQLRARPVVSADRSSAAWIRRDGIAVIDLAAQVTRVHPCPVGVVSLALDATGHQVAASFMRGGGATEIAVWTAARAGGVALRGWFERLTNATLVLGSDVVAWP